MKKIVLLITFTLLILVMVGCGKETIIGRWYDEESDLRVKFLEDNTCEFANVKADYRIEDDKLILIVDGVEQVMTYTLEGDDLELIFDVGDDFSLHLKRIDIE